MTNETNTNPLLCDLETGICGIPGAANAELTIGAESKPIHITYFTDPICSSCWGIEPQLKKLKLEYGDLFTIEYRMGGLLPDWSYNSGGISKPSDVAPHWEEAAVYYGMPIDGDVWLEDPLSSSFPPSVAFKAAQIQSDEKALLFMRRLRELLFLKKKNITRWEYIQQAAAEVGLDTFQLRDDFAGKAPQLFQDDLKLGRQLGVRSFPTLFFTDQTNNKLVVYGSKPYESYENAILKLLPQAPKKAIDTSWEALFTHFPTLTTKEFSVLSGRSTHDSEVLLDALVDEHKVEKMVIKNGVLWTR